MSPDYLTAEAKRENAIALASALGIDVAEAATTLDLFILVTADEQDQSALRLARECVSLLSRTVQCASEISPERRVAAELVIGCASQRTEARAVRVDVLIDRIVIGRAVEMSAPCAPVPPILALLGACYASAAAFHYAIGGRLATGIQEPLVVEFAQLGVTAAELEDPVDLGRAYLAGAGAIGNGFLWAARFLNIRGQIDIADDDVVSSGNLNRQIWFESRDVGQGKADRLASLAQPHLPQLRLVPRPMRLQDLPERSEGPWLERLIVAVDSRRARRALQNEFPGEVFDASTTDIREVVVSYNRQPGQAACLSCIYEPDLEEHSRERHISEHLGVPLQAVRAERISESEALSIATKFPGLVAADLVGTAYDSLFKRLCAESALQTQEGKRVVAPFAFVSVLAGTMLALEVVRRRQSAANIQDNYWRLSPWHSPLVRRRVMRPRQINCSFCANPVLQRVNESLWRRP